MSIMPRRTPDKIYMPEMKRDVPMPEVKPPRKDKGKLSELLDGLPEDFRKRVQSVWVNSDGSVSIDFAPDGKVDEDGRSDASGEIRSGSPPL